MLHTILKKALSKDENEVLTPTEVLELEENTLEWEEDLGYIIKHVEFTPNCHRFSHIWRHILQYGRPFNFSMFGSETANMTSSRGVSGVKDPLLGIDRYYSNHLFYNKSLHQLKNNELFTTKFLKTTKLLFPNSFRCKNKDFTKLIKIYFPNSTKIQFYLESKTLEENNQHTSNKIIQFQHKNRIFVGLIEQILKEEQENGLSFSEDKTESEDSSENSSQSDNNHDIGDNQDSTESSEADLCISEDLEQVNIVSKSFEELIKENFEEYEKDKFVLKVNVCKTSKFKQIYNKMLAITPTNKILTIETNQVLKVYGYCYFNNQIVVFEI